MDTILLIIDIVYGVCRIVIKSVQQCTYFLFFVNLFLVGVNYGQRTVIIKGALATIFTKKIYVLEIGK
jgi:hypothetical protein